MADQVALRTFDYDELTLEDREHVRLQAQRICVLTRQAAKDIIAVGEILTDVKARLDHGQFEAWLKTEFGWGRTTAWRFMRVYEHFKDSNLEDLPIAPSALYLLAEPGTPEPARTVVIQRAQEGEAVSHAEAQRVVAYYKTESPTEERPEEPPKALVAMRTTPVEPETLRPKMHEVKAHRPTPKEAFRAMEEALFFANPRKVATTYGRENPNWCLAMATKIRKWVIEFEEHLPQRDTQPQDIPDVDDDSYNRLVQRDYIRRFAALRDCMVGVMLDEAGPFVEVLREQGNARKARKEIDEWIGWLEDLKERLASRA